MWFGFGILRGYKVNGYALKFLCKFCKHMKTPLQNIKKSALGRGVNFLSKTGLQNALKFTLGIGVLRKSIKN